MVAEHGSEMIGKINISAESMEQARAWYVRLADENAGGEEWEKFTLWLEDNPEHVAAYDHLELTLDELSNQADITADTNVIPLVAKSRSTHYYKHFVGLAAALLAAIVLFVTTDIFQAKPDLVRYATNIGGHKDIVLKDGTHISLNTDTQISVSMSKKTRQVTLEHGEVFFDIAQDRQRPFVVRAHGAEITDIGTAFSVYDSGKALTVSVAQGLVEIKNGQQAVRVQRGEQARHIRQQGSIRIRKIAVENISTWRDGVLVFEDAPLSSVVPELNRYFQTPIELAGDGVAGLTFSGVLNISDQDRLLGSMKALMPITSELKNGHILLSSKN